MQEQCWIQQKKIFQKLTSSEFWNTNEIRKDFLKPPFVSCRRKSGCDVDNGDRLSRQQLELSPTLAVSNIVVSNIDEALDVHNTAQWEAVNNIFL